jgi:DNA-binding response OmpR family regulator/HPt (histidine-containing phosphotransfer) domain-containing protein
MSNGSGNQTHFGDAPIATYAERYQSVYPGDDAVDWVGLDVYNTGPDLDWGHAGWRTFTEALSTPYAAVQQIRTAERVPTQARYNCVRGTGVMQHILVVDDDRMQLDVVGYVLRRAGFEPIFAEDAVTAARLFRDQQPELVILDVNLGESDGRDLLRQFRQERPHARILMLTVRNAEDDRVQGLELGADDYLTKPVGHRELVARVRALLRRGSTDTPQTVHPQRMQVGSLELDPSTHEVTRAGRRVDLSPTEFRLLQALMERPNVLVSTRTLLKEVWGHQDLTARNVLRVTASRLRAKLEVGPAGARMLQTVPGEGFMLRSDAKTVTPPPPPDQPPVSPEIVAELLELADEMGAQPLQQLNEVFVRSAAKHVQGMRDALFRRDGVELGREAHRLRGNSASLGAQRVTRVCAIIEEQSRGPDLSAVDALLQQLERELEDYQTAIVPMLN